VGQQPGQSKATGMKIYLFLAMRAACLGRSLAVPLNYFTGKIVQLVFI